jgi:hypothetical protein
MPDLQFPGQEPLDPAYVRFRDGWAAWIIDKRAYPGLRWSPPAGGWRVYALDKYDYIDFGVTGPKSPLSRTWQFDPPVGYIWRWDDFFTPNFSLPPLFEDLNAAYARVRARRPAAVWNPYEGSWRDPRPHEQGPGEGQGPVEDPPVNPDLQRRTDELLTLYREHKITDELLKQRMLELLREYT